MELNEKQKNKLLKTLGKWKVTPEEAAEFLKDYTTDDEEPMMEAETPAEAEAEPSEPKAEIDEGEPTEEVEAPAVPEATEEPEKEPQAEEPIQPAEETEQLPEPPAPEEAEKPVEQEPLPDPKVEELEKAVEGLSSRLDSFIDSLTKAGILVQAPTTEQVGIETEKGFGNSPKDESIGDTLARLNRGKSY